MGRTTRLVARAAVLLVAAAVAVVRFLAIDATSHSASDTLRPWFIELVPITVVAALVWVAIARFSKRAA